VWRQAAFEMHEDEAYAVRSFVCQVWVAAVKHPLPRELIYMQSFVVRAKDSRVQFGWAREIEPNRAMWRP
jgi:hypothetical protein